MQKHKLIKKQFSDIWMRIKKRMLQPDSQSYKDFTIKAKLTDLDAVEKAIIALEAKFVGEDVQTDHYFETSKGKLKWREGTIENLITHYERFLEAGIERTTVYRYDLNPSKSEIDELFQNQKIIGIVKKTRRIYSIQNIKIHLDLLPNHEKFIEIEAIDRSGKFTIDELRDQCLTMKAKLRIADHDLIPTGYLKI